MLEMKLKTTLTMAQTYEIIAQEIWLIEKTYKCAIEDAVYFFEDKVSIGEVEHEEIVLKKRFKNSVELYPKGFQILWGEFPKSGTFKVREVKLVSSKTYSVNDSPEDATYCYEDAYETTEPGDFEVLKNRFIDEENYYSNGYEIYEVRLA
jgi:hypothetical protein